MTAAARTLSPPARALLAWLQERPAAGEGSLKAWGQARRPSLTLTQVEVRAAELVEAGLATREVKADGRSIYRAATLAPRAEPAPVEVVTEPGWIPRVDAAGSFFGVARSEPAPCAECARLAEALLSWERQWGVNGTDLAAMEARIRVAERERDEARAAERATKRQDVASYVRAEEATTRLAQVTAERDQLAARAPAEPTPPEPPTSLSPNAQGALAILSTTRGTSPHEIATRSHILRRSVPHALAELRAAGLAYESTPGLWRRR